MSNEIEDQCLVCEKKQSLDPKPFSDISQDNIKKFEKFFSKELEFGKICNSCSNKENSQTRKQVRLNLCCVSCGTENSTSLKDGYKITEDILPYVKYLFSREINSVGTLCGDCFSKHAPNSLQERVENLKKVETVNSDTIQHQISQLSLETTRRILLNLLKEPFSSKVTEVITKEGGKEVKRQDEEKIKAIFESTFNSLEKISLEDWENNDFITSQLLHECCDKLNVIISLKFQGSNYLEAIQLCLLILKGFEKLNTVSIKGGIIQFVDSWEQIGFRFKLFTNWYDLLVQAISDVNVSSTLLLEWFELVSDREVPQFLQKWLFDQGKNSSKFMILYRQSKLNLFKKDPTIQRYKDILSSSKNKEEEIELKEILINSLKFMKDEDLRDLTLLQILLDEKRYDNAIKLVDFKSVDQTKVNYVNNLKLICSKGVIFNHPKWVFKNGSDIIIHLTEKICCFVSDRILELEDTNIDITMSDKEFETFLKRLESKFKERESFEPIPDYGPTFLEWRNLLWLVCGVKKLRGKQEKKYMVLKHGETLWKQTLKKMWRKVRANIGVGILERINEFKRSIIFEDKSMNGLDLITCLEYVIKTCTETFKKKEDDNKKISD